MSKRRMTAIEALYGFGGWLTSRRERSGPFGSKHNAATMGQLIHEFAKVNKLGKVREGVWPKNLTHPSDDPPRRRYR